MKRYPVGQDHPRAVLTDAEVDQLLEDRGPDDAPKMSYGQLAARYGISKSCVRMIVTGSTRGRVASEKRTARVEMILSLPTRTKLMRMGGAKWIEEAVAQAFRQRCAEHEVVR